MPKFAKFYVFRQSNSGAYYYRNDDISDVVIIEALSEKSAIRKASRLGMFGLSYCECCGPRFREFGFFEYDTLAEITKGSNYRVHYRNGTIERAGL